MKHLFLLLFSLSIMLFSCSKQERSTLDKSNSLLVLSEHMIQESSTNFGDGPIDQPTVFSMDDAMMICSVEDRTTNIWSDEDILKILPIDRPSDMTYEEKLNFLRSKIPVDRSVNEGATRECVNLRWNKPPRHDASLDIVAQTLAASGTFVGQMSSLNFWRPTFPFDAGTVTPFDITRSMIASQQVLLADTEIEYDPNSIIWEYQVSGQNWIIGVDITTYDSAGQPTIHHFCEACPLGSLIWNPTLDSPAEDDLIQGPMPLGYVAISANGLTPPSPSY